MSDIRVRVGQQNAIKVIAGATPGLPGGQGIQGVQGVGSQGIQGPQGIQGVPGNQGFQGVQGLGAQGTSGEFSGQGIQGTQGLFGPQGIAGFGIQGTSGSFAGQGVQGTAGDIEGNIVVDSVTSAGIVTGYDFVGFATGLFGIDFGNTYYVSIDGDDLNAGIGINRPFRTLKTALENASSGDNIYVGTGIFTEEFPLTVPQGVSITGSGIRCTFIQPTNETKQNDCFYLNGETEVSNLTLGNYYEPGWGFRFAPNMKTTIRSPYVQRVTVLNRGTTITSTDPYGFNTPHNPPVSYKGGRGALIDGSVVDPATLHPAILFNECTFITPNNTALEMTEGARTEWVNCFTYFADKSIYGYSGNVGLGSIGKTRLKITGITTISSIPAENDLVYYFEQNTKNGLYQQIGTGVSVTYAAHGLLSGDRIYLDFPASQSGFDGIYGVSGITSNTFNVTTVGSATTSGIISYKKSIGYGTIHSYSSGEILLSGKGVGKFEKLPTRTGKQVISHGDVTISTEEFKFGTGSAKFLLGDGYLQIADNSDYGFGTDQFTLECFIKPSTDLPLFTTYKTLIDLRKSSSDNLPNIAVVSEYDFNTATYSSNLVFRLNQTDIIVGTTELESDVWHHVALCRFGSITKLYLDGVQQGDDYIDFNNYGSSNPVLIGSSPSLLNSYSGYIDEIRISNIARYVGNFVPTTIPFVSDTNTRLLLNCDGEDGSIFFTDSTIITQDIRIVSPIGIGSNSITTATEVVLADYQQFGADMRSIGSAAVFGNTGVTADGLGVKFRLFAFNFGHIGSGGDFSQDESIVIQDNEAIEIGDGKVLSVSIDQSGNFRVGNLFSVNEEQGLVSFSGETITATSFSDLTVTDGVNTTSITPSSIIVGNIQFSNNEITSTSGEIEINPSGISSTRVVGGLNIDSGNVYVGVNTSYGLVLTSPNGSKFRLIVDNSGSLSTVLT
jgi:hypothetical protein